MSRQNRVLVWWSVFAIAVIGGLIALASFSSMQPGKLDAFAQCLEEQGTKFYGAFWCPHCNDQKRMFDRSISYVPYIECSTPDGRGQLPLCQEAGITAYPTWVFADGTQEPRVLALSELAEKTGCVLPTENE